MKGNIVLQLTSETNRGQKSIIYRLDFYNHKDPQIISIHRDRKQIADAARIHKRRPQKIQFHDDNESFTTPLLRKHREKQESLLTDEDSNDEHPSDVDLNNEDANEENADIKIEDDESKEEKGRKRKRKRRPKNNVNNVDSKRHKNNEFEKYAKCKHPFKSIRKEKSKQPLDKSDWYTKKWVKSTYRFQCCECPKNLQKNWKYYYCLLCLGPYSCTNCTPCRK